MAVLIGKENVMEFIFSKAAMAALLKICSIMYAYLLIRGIVRRTAQLKSL